MSHRWRTTTRLLLAICFLITALPLSMPAAADEATPPGTIESSNPTTVAQEPTEAPQQVSTTAAPADPTIAATSADTTDLQSAAAEGDFTVAIMQCDNTARAGTFDFNAFSDASTSSNCGDLDPTLTAVVTLTPLAGGAPITLSTADNYSSYIGFGVVAAGSYTITIAIGNDQTTSDTIVTQAGASSTTVSITYFVAGTTPPTPDTVGFGAVSVGQIYCQDPARVGETNFLVSGIGAAATANCMDAKADDESFTLESDDGVTTMGPLAVDSDGTASFDDVPYGNWTVSQDSSGTTSDPISLGGAATGSDVSVVAITYVAELPEYVSLFVQKVWCEDDGRAGTTEFTLDTESDFSSSAASTCYSQPSLPSQPSLSITVKNLDSGFESTQPLSYLQTSFDNLIPGTYTLTESDGVSSITSDPFTLEVDSYHRVRIINYIAESVHPTPYPDLYGFISGQVLFCSAPGRDGDVDFIIDVMAAAIANCKAAGPISNQVILFPAAGPDGPIDLNSGHPAYSSADGSFYLNGSFSTGYYALGYQAPTSDSPILSRVFPVSYHSVNVEINVFTDPVSSTDLSVYKDICVDPALAGQARFFINQLQSVSASASVECRYARESDGSFTITLTNTETSETQTGVIEGSSSVYFTGLTYGTFTLTEEHDGQSTTSEPFTIDPSLGTYQAFVRNYIAEMDWSPSDNEGDYAYISINGYACVDQTRDGGGEFFHYNLQFAATSASTAQCRPATAADNFRFVANPVASANEAQAAAVPVSFVYVGDGRYQPQESLTPGDYVITELTTNTSTAQLPLNSPGGEGGNEYLDFLSYQPFATPTPTATSPVGPTPTATTPVVPTTTAKTPTASPTKAAGTTVTSLPTTGQGTPNSSGSLPALLFAGLGLAILGAGLGLRQIQNKRR